MDAAKALLLAAIIIAATVSPVSAASVLQNCRASVRNFVICTVIEQGARRVVDMSFNALVGLLKQSYSAAPAPSPLEAARCSVTCGRIFDAPAEMKAYAIEDFFRYNCPVVGYSIRGTTCVRP